MSNRKTKATRGQLERAIDNLDSFYHADNIHDVTSDHEQWQLAKALDIIKTVESRMYGETI